MLEAITTFRDKLDESLTDLWENRRRELKLGASGLLLAGALAYGVYWWVEVRFACR
jgi:hypothetical protein